MTLYFRDDSSYAKTQQLQLSSKLQLKQDDQADEIAKLCEKISQMQKNYIAMERHYAQKIKVLYGQINEKDVQFKRLKNQMQEIRNIGTQHRKKVEQLNKNTMRKTAEPRVKSKSPVMTSRTNNKGSINNVQTQTSAKSPSPKNESKKISPSHKPATVKKSTAFPKNSMGTIDSGSMNKNTSSEKFTKKGTSPKHSYQNSKKILPKVDEVESIKIIKKPSTGVGSFRQKAPAFK